MNNKTTWLNRIRARLQRPAAPPEERRLGLALSGGGGKGAAHIGVLQVMQELEIPIDLIVGTSAGGAVAVLYAAGFDLAAIQEMFRQSALRRIATPDPTGTGIIGQRRREELLRRLLGDRTFADLRIPCAVVATDLVSSELVVLHEGPVVPALLATTALPALFPPMPYGDMLLADGGILNNLPVDVAYEMGAQRVIAVDLRDANADFSLQPEENDNLFARLMFAPKQFAVAQRALSLLMAEATELRLQQYPPDLLIQPDVSSIATLDLTTPEKGFAIGVVAARELAGELTDLRLWRKGTQLAAQPQPARPPRSPALPAYRRVTTPVTL
ncbi:patatin-like phospholipase family protein [Chloroflexus sp.]|uniref:patatin-like phospholipase family protein n=1 Tax=Chloroflexus sp. TaxID=1904827 RepID=UPI002ACD8D20|nr:patatin-like phospholipase family protein [Chloroflexus sp.]